MSTLDFGGHLFIPMLPEETNSTLRFILKPDSKIAEVAEIVISIPKDSTWFPGRGWSQSDFESSNDQYCKCIGAKYDLRSLLANDWVKLPELTFPKLSKSFVTP